MLKPAPDPHVAYNTTKLINFSYFAIIDNYDITVDGNHEFYANGVNVKNCLGSYHPHGDSSVYDALVGMVNLPVPLLDGHGNFGDLFDSAAAMRYTESRLSKFADKFLLNPDYLAVIDYHPNYDWSETEPLYLPSLVPTLLFNGSSGIAVGVTSDIPPFAPTGVLKLAMRALKGKQITAEMCAETLVVNHRYGSHDVSDPADYLNYFETGVQSLTSGVDYKEDVPNKAMLITGITPNFSIASTMKKLDKIKEFAGMENMPDKKNPINFVVKFKREVDRNQIPSLCKRVYELLFTRQAYRTNVTHRKSETDVTFRETNVPQLLMDWAEYRIDLERKCQKYKMGVYKDQIDKQNLLILAAQNAMFITKTVRSDAANPRQIIMQKLKITDEDAKYILGFTFQQISKLNEDQINKKVRELKAHYAQAKTHFEAPAEKCQLDMAEALAFFN